MYSGGGVAAVDSKIEQAMVCRMFLYFSFSLQWCIGCLWIL